MIFHYPCKWIILACLLMNFQGKLQKNITDKTKFLKTNIYQKKKIFL